MLVLTRQTGEKICIGDKIVIEITHNGSDRVRLGVSAPPEKVVLRGELYELRRTESGIKIEKSAADVPSDPVVAVARCG